MKNDLSEGIFSYFFPLCRLPSLIETCQQCIRDSDMHEKYSCTGNHLSPAKIEKCNSAKRLLLLNCMGDGGGGVTTFHWEESSASWAYRGVWQGITEGSSELRWISNLKRNTFYRVLRSGKRLEQIHKQILIDSTGSEGQKQKCFNFIFYCHCKREIQLRLYTILYQVWQEHRNRRMKKF